MSRILITGIRGNVGKYLAHELSKQYNVVGIYRGNATSDENYSVYNLDLSEQIPEIDNIETVIHCAACLSGSAIQMVNDNVISTINLIQYAERYNIRNFIYLSSVSVYGNVNGELRIDSDIKNPGIYGGTKYIAEEVLLDSHIPNRMIIGLPRMLGPYVNLRKTSRSGFLTMTNQIINNDVVECYIPDVKYNNFLHVDDLTNFIIYLLENDLIGKRSKVLLGVNEQKTMIEILEIMKESINSKSKIIQNNTGNEPDCACISIERAKEIGFNPMSVNDTISIFMNDVSYYKNYSIIQGENISEK